MNKIPKPVYYFGPRRVVGHYLYDHNGYRLDGYRPHIPNLRPEVLTIIDGGFCPLRDTFSGEVQTNRIGMWIILSWWDRSIDTKPNSNSNILGFDYDSVDALVSRAREAFPDVFERQKVTLNFNP